MIIASDTTDHLFLTKFPLETFIPFPSLIPDFVPRHAVCTCPVNRIPVEILVEIFFCTLRNYAGDWGMYDPPLGSRKMPGLSFSPGSSSDPMMLAQVCRRWRSIVLSTSMLWSSLRIICNRRGHYIPLLKTWLKRSGTCPLTISLIQPYAGYHVDYHIPKIVARMTAISSVLVTQASRWKVIDFRFAVGIPPSLTSLDSKSLPILESAAILSCGEPTLIFEDHLPSLDKWGTIYSSPAFRRGKWQFGYLYRRLEHVPWKRLTHIEVAIPVYSLFEVLPLCECLEDLRYTDASTDMMFLPPDLRSLCPVVLPCLHKLSLHVNQQPDTILNQLTLPSLTTFNVRQNYGCERPSSFTELLTRSQCRLQSYGFEDGNEEGQDILLKIIVSPTMASLAHLSVQSTRDMCKLVTFLTNKAGLPKVLPRLEKLNIRCFSSTPGALADMAFSRRSKDDSVSLLRDIRVKFWFRHQVDLERFRILGQQGMLMDI